MPRPRHPPARTCLFILFACGLYLGGCQRSNVSDSMAQAVQYRAAGNTGAALIELKSVLQQDGTDRHARVLLGEVLLDHGDPVQAEAQLRRAAALGADPLRLPALLGRALLMQGKYDVLLAEVNPAAGSTTAAVTRPAMLSLRGHALLGLNRPAEARALFAAALAQNPSFADALIGNARLALADQHPDEAAILVEQALLAQPDHADSLRFQADLLRLQGKPELALAAYERMLALRPQHARTLLDMAALHTERGHFKHAHDAIERARRLAGPTVALVYAEAVLAFRENQLGAALAAVQKILQAVPDDAPAVLLAGTILSAQGATQQASIHLQHFLAAHPEHLYASKLMSALKVRSGDTEGALALLHPLMEASPADVELLTLAGEAHLHAKQFSAASVLFERASSLRPEAASLHAALALSRLDGGEDARAIAELERAAALDRRAARTGILLVMTQLRAQAPDKALAAVLAMEQAGDNPLVQNLKGGVLMARGDPAGARACFNKALALEALYLPALANLAQLDMREHKAQDARQRYAAALEQSPRNVGLLDAMAQLAQEQGDMAAALAWMERASRLETPSLARGLRMTALGLRAGASPGGALKALGLARGLQAAWPESPEALALLGQAQALNGQIAAALDSYARLATMAPRSPLPHVHMATLHLAGGQRAAAEEALRHALMLDPDRLDAQLGLLQVLIGKQEYAAAHALAAAAQRRHPRSAHGHKLEGDLLMAQGRMDVALAAYERAFGLEASAALLAQIHGALSRLGRTGDADARFEQWLRKHPDDVSARLYFASSKLMRQEDGAAIAQLEAVLQLEPDNVLALNDLAWSCQRSGDRRALGYAERAFALAPASPAVLDTLGWIHLDSGNLPRALPLLQKAAALAPQASEIRFHFGQVLARTGDRRGARRELEKLLASPQQFARRAEAAALLATL